MGVIRSTSVCLILLCLVVSPLLVLAEEPYLLKRVEISPTEGTIETEILIIARGEPYRGPNWHLYVYYDNKCLIQRASSVQIAKTAIYEHRWDRVIKPPPELPFSTKTTSKNKHHITIVVEDENGDISSYRTEFKIREFIPPLSWWEQLEPSFIEKITGPSGDQGEPGIVGESITGPVGPQGSIGIQGETGVHGKLGPQGPTGPEGKPGKDANADLAYIAIILSIISLVGIIFLWRRR